MMLLFSIVVFILVFNMTSGEYWISGEESGDDESDYFQEDFWLSDSYNGHQGHDSMYGHNSPEQASYRPPVQPGQNYQPPVQPGQHYQPPVQPGQSYQPQVQPGQNYQPPVQHGQNYQPPVQPGQNYQPPVQPGQSYQPPFQANQQSHYWNWPEYDTGIRYNQKGCCVQKKVGSHYYHLVDGNCKQARLWDCSSDCCYTRENMGKDSWYCFRHDKNGLPVSNCTMENLGPNQSSNSSSAPYSSTSSNNQTVDAGALLIGGFVNGNASGNVELIGTCNNSIKIEHVPQPAAYAAAAVKNGSIYLCGGYRQNITSNCLTTDEHGAWKDGPTMNYERTNFTLNIVGPNLVAIGGCGENECYDSVEILNSSESWTTQAYKLPETLHSHCAVTLSDTSVMVIGGEDTSIFNLLAFQLDTNSGNVTRKDDLPLPIKDHACTLYDSKIIVSGGTSFQSPLRSVYYLDYRSEGGEWTVLNQLGMARTLHTMHVVNGILTVYGGVDGSMHPGIEELVGDTWVAKDLDRSRYGHASIVHC